MPAKKVKSPKKVGSPKVSRELPPEDIRIIIRGKPGSGGTYNMIIPRNIREVMGLKGGEYFLLTINREKRTIKAQLAAHFAKALRGY